MNKKTAAQFAKALVSLDCADEIPEGWITAREFAHHKKISVSHSQKILRDLSVRGLTESKKFKIDTPRGFYPVPHYRIK